MTRLREILASVSPRELAEDAAGFAAACALGWLGWLHAAPGAIAILKVLTEGTP